MPSLREFPVLNARTPVGLLQLNHKLRIITMNSRAEKLFGVTFKEARKRRCFRVCPFFKSEDECVKCVAKRALRDGKMHRALKTFNDTQPVELTGLPVRTEEGVLIGSALIIEDFSEAHAREREFAEKDRILQALWNEMREGVFILAANGAILSSNPAAARQIGMARKPLRGKKLLDLMDEREMDQTEEPTKNGEIGSRSFKATFRRSSGNDFFMVVSSADLGKENKGSKIYVTSDLTAQRRLENEIRFYKRAVDMCPNQLVMLDDQNRIFYANKSMEKMVGKPRQDIIGRVMEQAFEEDAEGGHFEGHFLEKEGNGFFERTTDSGSSEKYTLRSFPIRGADKARIGSIVTARKMDGDAPVFSVQRGSRNIEDTGRSHEPWPSALADIFNQMPAGVFVQANDKIVYANTALCELMGETSQRIKRKNVADFLDDDSKDAFYSFLRMVKSRAPQAGEVEIDCNRPFPHNTALRMRLAAHPNSTPTELVLIGLIFERSERGEAEEVSSDSQARSAQEDTAVNWAWDLMGSLQNVSKRLETALSDNSSGQWIDTQSELKKDLGRLEALVKNILASCGPDYHKKKVISLNELVERSLELLQDRIKSADITVKLSLSPYVKHMIASPQQILSLCIAMIERAIEITPAGGKLFIESRKRGAYHILEFQDTGINVANGAEKAIFEGYADGMNDSAAASTLLRIKNIVEQHGGGVRVRTSLDRGTRFLFTLPVKP